MKIADQNLRVHCVGIGGIGVSALARYFLARGFRVTGSDMTASEITGELQDDGIQIFIGHRHGNVLPGTNLIIYSPAVKRSNPELVTARHLKIRTLSYPQALGELTKKYFTIAVSGSHGKSTTTALIALIFEKAGLDPTVIIGTKLKEFGSSANNESGANFRMGKSKYLVIEADEWNRSFHHYFPRVAVLTNIDKEHLDTYKTFRGVIAGFAKYLKNLSKDGALIVNWQDKELRKLGQQIAKRKSQIVVFYNKNRFRRHPLQIPGRHNQLNAEAAWQTFRVIAGVIANNVNLGENNANLRQIANEVFRNYTGAWRRLEKLEIRDELVIERGLENIRVYTDYAHHPTEIKATLQALREKYPKGKIVCIFQPHQEDRLNRLFTDFIYAFDEADTVILLPVYKVAGRDPVRNEPPQAAPAVPPAAGGRISNRITDAFALAQEIKKHKQNVFYAPAFEAAIKVIRNDLAGNKVAVFMSAGDLDSQLRKFLRI